jgi:DNA-directed RNA polymerase subunit RPC12/RpoP
MKFPCCLCSTNLDIKISKKDKPYCTCDDCGIQLFFRGKTSISRLKSLLNSSGTAKGNSPGTVQGLILWNKLVQLKAQKVELEEKQGVIFRDPDLTNFISTVDNEIKRVQGELRKLSGKSKLEKKT